MVGPGGGWLYESPLWDHRRQIFLWVDIEAGDVHEFDPISGRLSVHRLGQTVACVALRSGGGYVLALRHAIAVTDDAFSSLEIVGELPTRRRRPLQRRRGRTGWLVVGRHVEPHPERGGDVVSDRSDHRSYPCSRA